MLIYPFPKKHFIIGTPRTGSTSLLDLIGTHPDIKEVFYEPFLLKEDFNKTLTDRKLSRAKIVEIYRLGDGIKELAWPEDLEWLISHLNDPVWPEDIENDRRLLLIKDFLSLPVAVIHTERDNILKQSISQILANKIKVWQVNQLGELSSDEYLEKIKELGPLSLCEVRKNIMIFKWQKQWIKRQLEKRHHLCINYNEFYLGKNKEEFVYKIFDHIGVKPIITKKMRDMLNKGKLNKEICYSSIKNINEIDQEFGSDENGYCFSETF